MLRMLMILMGGYVMIGTVSAQDPPKPGCTGRYDSSMGKNVYTITEEEAEFPGGNVAKNRFIVKNLQYPGGKDNEKELQTSVKVNFIVDEDGSLSHFQIPGKIPPAYSPLDKACIRMIQSGPKWIAAKCKGKPVASFATFHIACILFETTE